MLISLLALARTGTSSKSTKLVHGGIRYLQKAILDLDLGQWDLVKEALRERRLFLTNAPHLSNEVPILIPLFKYWQLPYYFMGAKMYDLLTGIENMSQSYVMGRSGTVKAFPAIKKDGLAGMFSLSRICACPKPQLVSFVH